ncbi:SPASM domain-containing protein [Solobacterium sp.]|uniref:SPASM domain-containing protein n=1 Tax=Solobacterium sp. TaxID=2060878 RepID=UPI001CB47B09|nr:SPASM domain-containing protein [Solobacterium sp.]
MDCKPIVFHKLKNYNDFQTCSGGKSELVIYNDGLVGICEWLIQGNLQVGNVYESSLYDIWKSEKLSEIIEPSRELFVNTECYDCSKFKECIYGKGICYVRAK